MAKFKAAMYIRLSYTDDKTNESDSVGNQRKLIENFVAHNPDIEVVTEKIDDGYSGILFDRPAFKEMMQDITDGVINCVIVKDLSRLGREYIETGRYLRRVFPAYGVRFIAINDSIDTARENAGDDLAVSVKNIMNEAYCRDISIKTRIIGKRAVIEVGGNKSRLKNREKWHIIPDHHPAIISKELFDLAQQMVRHFSQPNKKRHEYPLKGKIVCGCCKHVMSRSSSKNKYYYCRFSEPDETLSCHGLRIQTEQLEKIIFDVLKKHIDLMSDNEKAICKTGATSVTSECEEQISALQEEKMRLYERYVGGEIDAAQYSAEKSNLDAVLLKTKSAHAALTAEAKQAQEKHDEQVQRQSIIREVRDADAITPALADELIDKVYVFPDSTIKIAFSMPNLFEALV